MKSTDATVAIDINSWRAVLARPNWWSGHWDEIANLVILPNGTRLVDDVWSPPDGWVTRTKRLDFAKAIPASWQRNEARAEALLRRLKRLAAIDFTTTVRGGKAHSVLRPGTWDTWVSRNRSLHAAARAAVNAPQDGTPTRCPDGVPVFSMLSPTALEDVLPKTPKERAYLVMRMNALFSAGMIDDWPANDVGHEWSPSRRGDPNVTQPFSDQSFTTLCRAAFAIAELQEDLLACHREISAISTDEIGRCKEVYRNAHRRARLAGWRGTRLSPGAPLGMTLKFGIGAGTHHKGDGRVRIERFGVWPFRTPNQLRHSLSLCQTANWIILAAATGARAGEVESFARDTLIEFVPVDWGGEAKELALITGKTFKTELSGAERQWPLPTQAVEAFRRQKKLAEEMNPGGKSLWISRWGRVFMHDRIKFFCDSVSLDGESPIGAEIEGSVSTQRFRETLSRLVGLCLDNGHHVLFDVLGHREMDTTIGYMMSDPDFAAQARRVRHEAEAVRKRRIIGNADTMAGPAAKEIVRLRNTAAKQAFGGRMDLDKPGSADVAARVAEFAEIISSEEVDAILPRATIVRPGIYCVADEAQPGLCSKSTIRDVSRCSPFCHHHLEEAAANDDRWRSIQYVLDKMDNSAMTSLQRAFYQRQLLDQFAAAPALVDHFLNDPRLRAALADTASGRIAMLPKGPREKLEALLAGMP